MLRYELPAPFWAGLSKSLRKRPMLEFLRSSESRTPPDHQTHSFQTWHPFNPRSKARGLNSPTARRLGFGCAGTLLLSNQGSVLSDRAVPSSPRALIAPAAHQNRFDKKPTATPPPTTKKPPCFKRGASLFPLPNCSFAKRARHAPFRSRASIYNPIPSLPRRSRPTVPFAAMSATLVSGLRTSRFAADPRPRPVLGLPQFGAR